MLVNEDECKSAGLDIKKVESISRRLSKAAMEAQEMGLTVFGGSGTGTLRFHDGQDRSLIVSYLNGDFDGGDGACMEDENGLLRGE